VKKPKLNRFDRMLWFWFCATWTAWRSALYIVKPDTVIAWHRQGFRLFWTWKILSFGAREKTSNASPVP
jgi:putative transposase